MPTNDCLELNLTIHKSDTAFYPDDKIRNNIVNRKYDQIELSIIDFYLFDEKIQKDLTVFFAEHTLKIPIFNMQEAKFEGVLLTSAAYSQQILDALAAFTKEFPGNLVIDESKLQDFVFELVSLNHITGDQGKFYLKSIPTGLSLEKRETIARQQHDFSAAIALVKIYEQGEWHKNKRMALHWLLIANKFNSAKLQETVDLTDFLRSYTYLDHTDIFIKENESILYLLKNTVTSLIIDKQQNINEYLGEFIATSSVLKSLELNKDCHQSTALHPEKLVTLVSALGRNKSIKRLSLMNQLIGDNGLEFLLETILSNYGSKFKDINLYGCGITDKGAKAIIEYLTDVDYEGGPVIEKINLNGNRISLAYLAKINQLLEENMPVKTKENTIYANSPHILLKKPVVKNEDEEVYDNKVSEKIKVWY